MTRLFLTASCTYCRSTISRICWRPSPESARFCGRTAIFTATPEQVRRYWVNHYFPEIMARDYAQWPAIERMAPLMAENHLRLTDIVLFLITADTADFFFYSGKLRLEIY